MRTSGSRSYFRALTPGMQSWRQPGEGLLVVGIFVAYILLFAYLTSGILQRR